MQANDFNVLNPRNYPKSHPKSTTCHVLSPTEKDIQEKSYAYAGNSELNVFALIMFLSTIYQTGLLNTLYDIPCNDHIYINICVYICIYINIYIHIYIYIEQIM